METVNGEWIMLGCSEDDPDRLRTPDDLIYLIRRVGFLPLFSNAVSGFSVEEHTLAESWWTGDAVSDPWEWRHILAGSDELAYGKFFNHRAGYISKAWFPVFANYRRDGYDFDALFDDGFASNRLKKVMDAFGLNERMEGKILTASDITKQTGEKDAAITLLQMQTYLIVGSFLQRKNKKGEPYGWHIGHYETPETKWGYDFVTSEYPCDPKNSWRKIVGQVKKCYPCVTGTQVKAMLGIRRPNQDSGMKVKPVHPAKPTAHPKPETLPYPENLITAIGLSLVFETDDYTPLNEDQKKGLEYAMGTLRDREQDFVKRRYEQHQTLQEIAAQYHLSGNWIKQVIDKSIRKLRHPTRLICYQKGYTHTVQRREEMEQRAALINTNRSALSDGEIRQHLDLIREITIEEADFTVRTFNCLIRGGLSALGDIIDLINSDPNQLANIRNLGPAGQDEVLRKLKEYGAY